VTASAPHQTRVLAAVAVVLATILALHLFEPKLAITWSYAHLGRTAWLPWLAGAIAVALPFAVQAAWRHPAGQLPLTPWRPSQVFAIWLAVSAVALGIALVTQATVLVADVKFLHDRMADEVIVGRWHLLVIGYRLLVRAFAGAVPMEIVIRCANALLGSVALISIAGCARCLAATRREATAIAALCFTSLGIAQLIAGYADIYPVPLAIASVFCWLGLRTIAGKMHPAWAFGLGAIGPFVYLGMVLLAPALVAIAVIDLRRDGGRRRIALAAFVALLIGGAATIPGFGAPFALHAFYSASFEVAVANLGYSAGGYQLPLAKVLSSEHLNDVLNTMLLVDPVGWTLVFVPGVLVFAGVARSEDRDKLAFLLPMLAGHFAFLVAMDSLYGAYLDWDLYSYGSIWTSLLGGYALVRYAGTSRWLGLLLGLALATSSVHLMARLHAMDVDHELHVQESEPHIFKRLIDER
jgi:hypothetical protein